MLIKEDYKSKGELLMKRTLIVLALVVALVLGFCTVAGATYRGFTPVRTQTELDSGILQGFITFDEAKVEMERNNVPAELQLSAHGGYITTTTKCAVCHSAHRATGYNDGALEGTAAGSVSGDANLSNVQKQAFLTAGSTTCEGCHVSTGAQASRLLVEWGSSGGGPHLAPRRGCLLCHNAGIHGLSTSSYNVMNVFMLGNTRRQTLLGSDWPADGSWFGGNPETRDEQIAREIEEGRVLRGGVLDVPADSPLPGVLGDPSEDSTWWYDGERKLAPIGGVPEGLGTVQYAAARSLATAYTCGESGCHTSSAMFNLNWGMGFARRHQVKDPDTGFGQVTGRTMVTGHVMPVFRAYGNSNQACGPCHAGNPAGFPTASTELGKRDDTRRAYGCDQCHDMVGVATNSTAFPHGNRGLKAYEWLADGTQIETDIPGGHIGGGNLWMYGGSIARADHPDIPATDASQVGAEVTAAGGGGTFRGPTSTNVSFADQSWTILTGVTAGRYGIPGHGNFPDDPDAPFGNPQLIDNPGTGLTDGSCLKCHVPLDDASRNAMGSLGADALRHAWNRGGTHATSNSEWGDARAPKWTGVPPTNSSRLFLYR